MEEYIADLQEQLITAQHRFMKMHRDLCFTGLRKSEFVMLEIIERENGNREQGVLASDIAKRLRITAPAVSKMLRSMEEKGYVERRVDEKDRRNTRVSITPDGKEAEQQVRRQMQEFITGVIERLGEEPVDLLEINVSCPNVKEGGIAFGQNPKALEDITKEVKKYAKQPVEKHEANL